MKLEVTLSKLVISRWLEVELPSYPLGGPMAPAPFGVIQYQRCEDQRPLTQTLCTTLPWVCGQLERLSLGGAGLQAEQG